MMIKALIVEQVEIDGTLQSFKMSPSTNNDLIVALPHEYEEPRFGPFHFLDANDELRFQNGFANCKMRRLSKENFRKQDSIYEFVTNWQGIPTERNWLSYYALSLPNYAVPLDVSISDPHKVARQYRKQVNRDDEKCRFVVFLECSSSIGRFDFDLFCRFKVDKKKFKKYEYHDNKTENYGTTGDDWKYYLNQDQSEKVQHFFLGNIDMGDTYNNTGQVGAMGRTAISSNCTFQQLAHKANENIDIESLKTELDILRSQLKSEASVPGHDISIGEIACAQTALESGDEPKAIQHLEKAGKWALEVATKIGTNVAAAAIKGSMGI